MRPSNLVVLIAAVAVSGISNAQVPPPLPDTLKGAGMVSGTRRGVVNPVELTRIKQDGDKVTGVISEYRTANGQCEANNTPFSATYAGGVFSVRSARLESKKADGGGCGAMHIEATYESGSLVGTYAIGAQGARINVQFSLK